MCFGEVKVMVGGGCKEVFLSWWNEAQFLALFPFSNAAVIRRLAAQIAWAPTGLIVSGILVGGIRPLKKRWDI